MAKNQFLLTTSAAPACGVQGAQKVAAKMAAVETLRRGYDRFIIGGASAQNNVSTVRTPYTGAYTTGTFNTYGNTTYGYANTTYTGGQVIFTGSNDAQLAVLMLKKGEPGFANGVDARDVLGPKWKDLVEKGVRTCS
ncbi:hypothetical protein [Fuscibacter oryzae]|uniref:Uncharacterized protein n=1 Tax=Fuscibacter oryzae TaxID=2803939 RepID=A0A8J7SS30_9RHOB|nr:hypothetical protein [Fuscibacter oryzae]MBL4927395.1 hypothetical protein [Fuscibacter oryzae]